jgi:tripartite-type tricarboxylate transporter receptor subunit TctC
VTRYRHMENGSYARNMEGTRPRLWSLLIALIASAACLLVPVGAQAQWPNRVIHLIVPFGPGSSSDTIARVVAVKMSEQLRQQVIVENRVGGSTIIGTEAIARATPDGYTIGLANTTTHAASAALTPKLPFDPTKDFSPIAMIGSSPFLLLGSPEKPSKTLQEFISLAKAQPGKLSYASAGTGTLTHLAGELVKWKTGIDVTHVPYRGSEQSLMDLMAGRIDMLVGTIAPTLAQIRQGNLRAFAIMSDTRSPILPEVPTIGEAGAPGCEAALWTALVAPAGVPAAIITRLNQAVVAAVNSPEVQQSLKIQGITPEYGSSEDVAARIRADVKKWKDVADGAKINGAK